MSGALPAVLYAGLHLPLGSTRLALHARSYSAIRAPRVVQLTRLEWRFLALLAGAQSFGSPLYYPVAIEALWGDDPDGGPLTPGNVIKVVVCRLRKKIAPLNLSIQTLDGQGRLLVETTKETAAKSLRIAA